MTVLKGFLLAVFVVFPGIALAAYVAGLGLGVVVVGLGIAAGWMIELVGVPKAQVWTVGGTLAAAVFIFLCAVALRSDTSNRL